MSKFGKNVLYLRTSKGIQQKDLAKEIGIKAPTLSRYEKKGENPHKENLKKIADFFEVEIYDIMYKDLEEEALKKGNIVEEPVIDFRQEQASFKDMVRIFGVDPEALERIEANQEKIIVKLDQIAAKLA